VMAVVVVQVESRLRAIEGDDCPFLFFHLSRLQFHQLSSIRPCWDESRMSFVKQLYYLFERTSATTQQQQQQRQQMMPAFRDLQVDQYE
jgi:hypothetical protein